MLAPQALHAVQDSVRSLGQTIVMVTHDAVAASFADRALFLADGKIVDEVANPSADDVLDRLKSFDLPAHRGN